jgi:hypothetical protein
LYTLPVAELPPTPTLPGERPLTEIGYSLPL